MEVFIPNSSPLSRVASMTISHTKGDAWYAYGIRAVTRAEFNHSLVEFSMMDGRTVYFESYWKKDKITGKTGVRGPVPIEELEDWLDGSTKRKIRRQVMPYRPEQCQIAYDFLVEATKTIKYTKYQLWRNLLTCTFGMGMRASSGSPNAWTCSECAARTVGRIDPAMVLNYLKIGEIKWDMVVPENKKYGLMNAIEAFLNRNRRK